MRLIPYPDCSVCHHNRGMRYDGDTWSCDECGTTWNRLGENGRRQ